MAASLQGISGRQCVGTFIGMLSGAALILLLAPMQSAQRDAFAAAQLQSKTQLRPSVQHTVDTSELGATAVEAQSALAAPTPSCPAPANAKAPTYITGVDAVLRLYTPEGNQHNAWQQLDPARLSPLTHEAQEYIYNNQHPSNCKLATFLVSRGHVRGNGIGSIMHVSGSHLSGALETGRVFLWAAETGSEWTDPTTCGDVKNFECHFLPPSHCTLADAAAAAGTLEAEMHYGAAGQPPNHVPRVFVNQLRELVPGMRDDEMKYWWRGQSVAYLMRLNAQAVAAIRALRFDNALHTVSSPYRTLRERLATPPLPPGSVHAHVRHGDKYTEMVLQSTGVYFNASEFLVRASPMFVRRVIFISTEDAAVLDEARAYNESWSMVYSNIPRSNVGPLNQLINLGADRAAVTARTHLMQLLMSMEADAWITTRGSNWNRVLDELRCIWVDKCHMPIVEVGTAESWANYNWRRM